MAVASPNHCSVLMKEPVFYPTSHYVIRFCVQTVRMPTTGQALCMTSPERALPGEHFLQAFRKGAELLCWGEASCTHSTAGTQGERHFSATEEGVALSETIFPRKAARSHRRLSRPAVPGRVSRRSLRTPPAMPLLCLLCPSFISHFWLRLVVAKRSVQIVVRKVKRFLAGAASVRCLAGTRRRGEAI